MLFTLWSIANFVFGFWVLDWTGRADVSWAFAAVVGIMAIFCGLNADIIATSNRKLRMLVRESSLTDPLTGLANRRRFRQVLDSHRVPEARPLAVLMYDLDNFKQLNEVEGHVHADGVLVQVAQELADSFRDADTVARYGGDEMIVLAHVDSLADAIALGERSLARVRERVGVTLSAGLSVYPLISRTLDAAVKEADTALGTAKHGGKARLSVAAPGPAAA
jgi:diguanylate cyclase (GGDEF)-like protein